MVQSLRGNGQRSQALVLGRAGVGRHPHLARLTLSGIITEDRKLTEAVARLARDDSVN